MKNNSRKALLKRIKILYNIACTLAGIGFFLLIGTAGALECDTIGLGRAIIQGTICGVAVWLFIKCAEYLNAYTNAIKYQIHRENEKVRKERVRTVNNEAQILKFMKQDWNSCGHIGHA